MTRRQAKKVLRKSRRHPAFVEADKKNRRDFLRFLFGPAPHVYTPGWRWGRWDPRAPTPPWELPF